MAISMPQMNLQAICSTTCRCGHCLANVFPLSDVLPALLKPEQLILPGTRDLDPAEKKYMERKNISPIGVLPETSLIQQLDAILHAKAKKHLYIRMDLDVLDARLFPWTPLPSNTAGYAPEVILSVLKYLRRQYDVVGTGIFEFCYNGTIPSSVKDFLSVLK